MVIVGSVVILLLSIVVLGGRHLVFSILLAAALFAFARISPVLTMGVYLLVFGSIYVAAYGLTALFLTGRLGPLLKRLRILRG